MKMFTIGVLFLALASYVSAGERTVTVMADNTPALDIAVPAAAKVTQWKDKTLIHTTNMFLYVWPVVNVKTLNEAQARLGEVIKDEVQKFTASATNEITVAGSPASHLIGTGVEADDGDDATADIVIFTVGGHVFIACVHGENNDASREQAPMLQMLQTANPPPCQPSGK